MSRIIKLLFCQQVEYVKLLSDQTQIIACTQTSEPKKKKKKEDS
jgi:hypothetical protein